MPDDGRRTTRIRRHFLRRGRFSRRARSCLAVELLIPIRRAMQQYINLRPCGDGRHALLLGRARAEDIDFWVVRENNEGEYSEIGGRLYQGTENELAMQETVLPGAEPTG